MVAAGSYSEVNIPLWLRGRVQETQSEIFELRRLVAALVLLGLVFVALAILLLA